MAKKHKTRKQKVLSDSRRQANPLPVIDTTSGKISIIPSEATHTSTHTAPVSTFSYSHLKTDLLKTAVITTAVIILEMIFKLFAK